MAINEITAFLAAAKTAIDIFKAVKSEMPRGPANENAQHQIEKAESALRAAEVQLAKSLGYHLCQCTFPPEIMLSVRRHERYGTEIFKCGKCGKEEPSEHHFRQRAEQEAAANRDADWIRARY